MKRVIHSIEYEIAPKYVARFWSKIDKTSDCWIWQGTQGRGGYGLFCIGHYKFVQTHRLSWMLLHGDIEDGMNVLHHCDNPSCVNPEHLWLGSHKDNMQDCARKGRLNHPRGESHPRAKLTWAQVREIRERYIPYAVSTKGLAAEYGVTKRVIHNIIHGINWNEANP